MAEPASEEKRTGRRRDYAAEPPMALRASFQAGDRDAIASLVRAFHADLLRFARRFFGGDDDRALDAVQDAFLTALERHRLYDADRPLRPWLFAVCRHCCLGAKRKAARGEAKVVAIEELRDGEGFDPPDPNAATALELLVARESDEAVEALLARLPEPSRAVVALRVLHGFTFAEIAASLEEPLPTVANRCYRALARLRAEIESRDAAAAKKPRKDHD